MLLLYSVTYWIHLLVLRVIFNRFLGIFCVYNTVISKERQFIYSFPIYMYSILCSCFIELAIVLHWIRSKCEYPCLISKLEEKKSDFTIVIDLMWRLIPPFLTCSEFLSWIGDEFCQILLMYQLICFFFFNLWFTLMFK